MLRSVVIHVLLYISKNSATRHFNKRLQKSAHFLKLIYIEKLINHKRGDNTKSIDSF